MGLFDFFKSAFVKVRELDEKAIEDNKPFDFFSKKKVKAAAVKTLQNPIARTGSALVIGAGTALAAPVVTIGAIGTGIAAGIGTLFGTNLLAKSPKVRDFGAEALSNFSPTEASDVIADIIEDKPLGETPVKDALTAGGITAALLAAGLLVVPKVKDLFDGKEKPLLPETPPVIPTAPAITTISQVPKTSEPQLVTVSDTPRKRYKRRTAKKVPMVKISIKNENYLNQRCFH